MQSIKKRLNIMCILCVFFLFFHRLFVAFQQNLRKLFNRVKFLLLLTSVLRYQRVMSIYKQLSVYDFVLSVRPF